MNRWDRLDYAKAQTYLDDGGGALFELAYRAQDATVTANKPFQDFEDSPNWKGVLRIIAYFLEGLFGF